MSHIVSLRSASLRALRSSSSVVAASKCTTYPHRSCQHQQQYSYSTLPPSPNRILITEKNKSTKRTLSDQTLSNDSSHGSVYEFTRRFHTSPIFFDSINVTTPAFPESVKEGTIRLLKKVGDKVSADETIAEIETDKSALSVNTPQAGVIEEFLVADGDNITSGAKIAKLNTSGDAKSSSSPPPSEEKKGESTNKVDAEQTKEEPSKKSSASSSDSVYVTTPAFPESVKEGTIRLLKKVGDKVSADETIAEIETDKSALSVNTPQAGVIEEFLAADGDNVTSGAKVAKLNTSGDGKSSSSSSPPSEEKKGKSTDKVDAEQTKGEPPKKSSAPKPPSSLTPSEGSKRDTSAPPKPSTPAAKPQGSGLDPNKISGTRSETRVKMSRMRLKIAERLKEAQNTCAMLTTFNEIDMSNIVEFRKKYGDQFVKRHNLKLGFMSAFVKASACALVDTPIANAVIDGNEIVYRDYVDISVAVASPKGLVVPVLRNVEKMSFADIERTIGEFGEKAKKGSLSIEDMDGGTFTISNGGVFGSLFGTPIINPPQSAILGMHGIFDRPVVINGKIEIRPMMYVAVTYDHRILDGRDAVLFLRKIKQYVEDSRTIFLDL